MLTKVAKKKIYSFDVDGVVADTAGLAVKLFNKMFEEKKTVNDLKRFHIIYDWIYKIENDKKIAEAKTVKIWNDKKVQKEAKPVKGSIELIDKLLSEGNEIHFITSRPGYTKKTTFEWFKRWLPDIETKFIHIGGSDKGLQRTFKVDEIMNLNPDVHFEDSIEHANDIANASDYTKIVLVRWPWNSDIETEVPDTIIVPDTGSRSDVMASYKYFLGNS